jgi:hypothetical protein
VADNNLNGLGQYLIDIGAIRTQQQAYLNAMQAQMLNLGIWQRGKWDDVRATAFKITGGNGNVFVARFECPVTADCFELQSLERPAVERGMRHYIGKWESAIGHLQSAGLNGDELLAPLAVIKPRLVAEAQRERNQEEGMRQAEAKAKALLVMCLTPEQQAEFEEHGRFTITVDHKVSGFPTGAFRIKKSSAFNVEHIESGETFCVVAQEKVPVYDQMLTQKLLLEQEPERFFKTANRSRGYDLTYGFGQRIARDQLNDMYRTLIVDGGGDRGFIERAWDALVRR